MSAPILALCLSAATVAVLAAGQRSADERNVTRLADRFGWRRTEAAEAYVVARKIGFGAAYRRVLAERPSLPA